MKSLLSNKVKIALVAAGVVLCAQSAFAQKPGGVIGLYGDLGGTNCSFAGAVYVNTPVYGIHSLIPGTTASQFKMDTNGVTAIQGALSDGPGVIHLGDLNVGIGFAYGGCTAGPIHAFTVMYLSLGTDPPCANLEIVTDPAEALGDIATVNCNQTKLTTTGGKIWFNGDEQTCGACWEVPVAQRSWGKIKALYK